MIHPTVKLGYHGEEYPIRITYEMVDGKPKYSNVEKYTQVGPDQEDWEDYDETDLEQTRWDLEIAAKLKATISPP